MITTTFKHFSAAIILGGLPMLSLMGADEPSVTTPKKPRYTMPDKGPERSAMQVRYKAAKTWEERRALCMEFIDSKIIDLGVEVEPIVKLFTLDNIAPRVTETSPDEGYLTIYFEEQIAFKTASDGVYGGSIGWEG